MKAASNNDIKQLRKLNRRKYREKEKLFLVEGERAVQQILENGFIEVEKIFIREGESYSLSTNSSVFELAKDIFDEVTDTENPQGIFAMCKIPDEGDPEKIKNEDGIIVATDAIQDPGNMGTIIRTAAWFGVKALLNGKGTVDIYNSKVVRSTAGATGSLPILSGELDQILPELAEAGWEIFLLDGGSESDDLATIASSTKAVLVVGNEANGVNERLLKSFKKIKIESNSETNAVESLNAAVALSIALFSLTKA